MKLLLRRTQNVGILGTPTFTLDVRAEISQEERSHIAKYRLGDATLFAKYTITDPGSGLLGFLSRLIFRAANLSLTVNDLANGKRIRCKDVVEMLSIEEHIREAGRKFMAVLRAAAFFGGEEVIEL